MRGGPNRCVALAEADRRALRGDERALGVVDGDVGVHLLAEPLHRGGDRARRAVALGDQPLVDLEVEARPRRGRPLSPTSAQNAPISTATATRLASSVR